MTDKARATDADAADLFAPETLNGQEADHRDQVIAEQRQQIEQMNHFIQLQANTISAFQSRTWKLEMEIVELMSQIPQTGVQPVPMGVEPEESNDSG